MKSRLQILFAGAALSAVLAACAASPASARGVCLPNSTRYYKCTDGKLADCTKSRNVRCKTYESCKPTGQPCDQLIR
jgi:hypothetical protein